MAKVKEYTDLYTHRNVSILPLDVQEATYKLGQALEKRSVNTALISGYRNSLKSLPASVISRAAAEIRDIAEMHKYYGWQLPNKMLIMLNRSPVTHQDICERLLEANPDLGWLLMFHSNGYLRQIALECIKLAPSCEFEVAAIVHRLNDWVGNVRDAASQYARKMFPLVPPDIVGRSSFFLLRQVQYLQRWDRKEREILDEAIYQPEVLKYLKEQFLGFRSGRVGYTLQQILRREEFDCNLKCLACEAAMPVVRAIAIEALLTNRASWKIGYKKQWVDKVYGISRRVAVYESRQLQIKVDFNSMLQIAASDKSAQVRKIAASVIIAHNDKPTEFMDSIAQSLKNDKNASVHSRIDFYLRKRAEH